MAAAEGSTCAGSSPKIHAVSMHRVGRTRLPPASIEYRIASSRPARRGSPVNLRPSRYPSNWRRWPSHRSALWAASAMRHLAQDPALGAPEYAAHERRRLVAGEAFRELDRLTDGDLGRDVLGVDHLEEPEPEDGAVYGAHAVDGPPFGDLREERVERLPLDVYTAHERDGVRVEVPPVLAPAGHGLTGGLARDVALIEGQERLLARGPPAQRVSLFN